MDAVLRLQDVRYRYNGKQVIAIDELEIPQASITGLAGPNGSGKTTLLKLLSCVKDPSSGSVTFTGTGAKKSAGEGNIRQRLCLLPQQTYLLKRSVFENIAYGLRIRGRKDELSSFIAEALELVGLSRSFGDRQWHELSGGEAQRVALAARLVLKPDCLLLDEPTASVDMESARCIRRAVLLARKEWGTTLIVASHHRSWLHDICDRIIYLYNGRVLNCSFENILTGPWEKVDESQVSCMLSDGQKVYVVNPPQGEVNAVIAPDALRINGNHPDKRYKGLKGVITSITRDNHVDDPQVYVSCGDQRFLVSIAAELLESEKCWPGSEVTLCYRPGDIIWLEK